MMLDNPAVAAKARAGMFIPVALRFSAMLPSVLKEEWITAPVDYRGGSDKDVFIGWFKKLCWLINEETFSWTDVSRCVTKVAEALNNLPEKYQNLRSPLHTPNDAYALVVQSQIIGSVDPIFEQIRDVLDINFMAWEEVHVTARIKELMYDMWTYGANDHVVRVLDRIEQVTTMIPPTNRDCILPIIAEMHTSLASASARDIALFMAIHKRLGGMSEISALGADILRMCVPAVYTPPKLIFWDDVLSEYM